MAVQLSDHQLTHTHTHIHEPKASGDERGAGAIHVTNTHHALFHAGACLGKLADRRSCTVRQQGQTGTPLYY